MSNYTIKASPGLEQSIDAIKTKVDAALEERRMLDLPEVGDFEVRLYYSESRNCGTVTKNENENPTVYLNIMGIQHDTVDDATLEKVENVRKYFRTILDGANNQNEESVFKILENPESVDDFISETNKKSVNYGRFRKYVIENAEDTKKLMKELLENIKDSAVNKRYDNIVRHEINHLQTADSIEKICEIENQVKTISAKCYSTSTITKKDCEQIALLHLKALNEQLDVFAEDEIKSLFFDYVDSDKWLDADLDKIKNDVHDQIFKEYINNTNSWLHGCVAYAFYAEAAKRDLNHETVDSTGQMITYVKLRNFTRSTTFDPSKVDYDVVEKVLYEEVPKLQLMFSKKVSEKLKEVTQFYKQKVEALRNRGKQNV